MRKILVALGVLVIALGWLVESGFAQMQSTNFKIPTQALSASGGAGTSTNFRQPASIGGQSTPIGPGTSTGFQNFAGYLYTLGGACAILGDVNLDMAVDVGDVVDMINKVVFGTPLPSGDICADVVPDGSIDVGDVVCLINNIVFSTPIPCPV